MDFKTINEKVSKLWRICFELARHNNITINAMLFPKRYVSYGNQRILYSECIMKEG